MNKTTNTNKILPFRQKSVSLAHRRSLTCGYENQALRAKTR